MSAAHPFKKGQLILQPHEREGVIVLALSGRLSGQDLEEMANQVRPLIEGGRRGFVLDLAHLTWMNSKGLGVVLSAYSLVEQVSGVLVVAQPSDRVKLLFSALKYLPGNMEVFDSVSEAVAYVREKLA